MRRFVVVCFMVIMVLSGIAQKPHTLLDTVMLDEISSYAKLRKYQSGAKIETLTQNQLNLASEGGIENILKRFSPIYIKSDAGGLSTIHFRGTSPDHTSINFGGINLNSLTLGHSNLSNIPGFLFDDIKLQYGSSAAVNGSGAVGGALYLGQNSNWTKGVKITAKSTLGSFGEYFLGTKVFTGNGSWESVSRAYIYQKENNFAFTNIYTGNVESAEPFHDIQKGASLKSMGLLQEINYRFTEKQYYRSSFWIENSWRQIQPNMQSNYHYKGTQVLDNDNIRIWTEYTDNRNRINFKGGLGYVHDLQVFDNIKEQIIQTDRLVTELQASTDFESGAGIKAGAKYKYIKPKVHAYADSVIDHEEHFDLFLSGFYRFNQNLKFTLNLRQMFVSDFVVPFTPSIGGEYVIRTGDVSFLKLSSAIAKSYRVPTLNDRYWGSQGNSNLKPEEGKNLEFGVSYNYQEEKNYTTIGLNAFYMDVENWIEWRNFGVWKAENVAEVVSKGIEFQTNTKFRMGKTMGDISFNYTFNVVEPVQTSDKTGFVNRQMNYIPKNMWNLAFGLMYKKWQFFSDAQYTGKRFSDDFGREMPAFFIANGGIVHTLNFKQHKIDLTFSVNNILNTDYQNERYFAMPGRFYRFSIKYDTKFIK